MKYVLLLLILLLITNQNTAAQGYPTKPMQHFWNMKNGLIQNQVTNVLCASNGDIWVGTKRGINHLKKGQTDFLNFNNNQNYFTNQIKKIFEIQNTIFFHNYQGIVQYKNNTFYY